MKNKNTLIWVGVASAVLIGGGIFWWMQSRKKQQEALRKKKEEEKKEEEKKEEEKEEPKETKPKSTGSGSGSVGSGGGNPSTGFKDKTEGDAFRKWFRAKYPDWKLYGDVLDETGGYDNPTIRAAFQFNKAGEAYLKELKEKSTTNITPTPTPTPTPKSVETTDPNAPKSYQFGSIIFKVGNKVYGAKSNLSNGIRSYYRIEGGGFNRFNVSKYIPIGSYIGTITEISTTSESPKVKVSSLLPKEFLPKSDDGTTINKFWVALSDITIAPSVNQPVVATTDLQGFSSPELNLKYEDGGTDNDGIIERNYYAGTIKEIKKNSNSVWVAKVYNVKNAMKDDNNNIVTEFWVRYQGLSLIKTDMGVLMNYSM